MGILDHLTCLLRNLYAGQEATVRTDHRTMHWFQIGKGVRQGCILSPLLFNLYAKYLKQNAGLDEAQAGIKIGGRNINNLRSADAMGCKGHFVSLVGHIYAQLSFQAQENSLSLFPLFPMQHRETALPELFSESFRNE